MRCANLCRIPTLVLAECILVYLDAAKGDEIINWFRSQFKTVSFIVYEPCNLNDSFGKVMINHLKVTSAISILKDFRKETLN